MSMSPPVFPDGRAFGPSGLPRWSGPNPYMLACPAPYPTAYPPTHYPTPSPSAVNNVPAQHAPLPPLWMKVVSTDNTSKVVWWSCDLEAGGGSVVYLGRNAIPEVTADDVLAELVADEPWKKGSKQPHNFASPPASHHVRRGGNAEQYGVTLLPPLEMSRNMDYLSALVFAAESQVVGNPEDNHFGPHNEAQVNFYPDGRFHLRQHKDHNRQHCAM